MTNSQSEAVKSVVKVSVFFVAALTLTTEPMARESLPPSTAAGTAEKVIAVTMVPEVLDLPSIKADRLPAAHKRNRETLFTDKHRAEIEGLKQTLAFEQRFRAAMSMFEVIQVPAPEPEDRSAPDAPVAHIQGAVPI